jgi:ABC-2 type transport system ATP-binding protein
MIEEVVILRDGEVIKNQSRDSLLQQGFAVTGSASAVDRFSNGKNVIGSDSIGGMKTAYILDDLNQSELDEGLEITKMDLQKLFVKLTNQ